MIEALPGQPQNAPIRKSNEKKKMNANIGGEGVDDDDLSLASAYPKGSAKKKARQQHRATPNNDGQKQPAKSKRKLPLPRKVSTLYNNGAEKTHHHQAMMT